MSELSASEKFHVFIGTGFYSGYSEFMPGTIGTIASIPFAILLNKYLPTFILFVLLLFFILYGCFLCYDLERIFNEKDSKKIVIDEWLGFFVAVFAQPTNFKIYFFAFLIFRFFDIVKPFPADYFDKHVDNGIGVVFDDIAAGLYTYILITIFFKFF